ncbi:MAG: histidinol dehydrogenase [Bacteroidales bacterium]|nr:histidinol dehydrogenase [Bacteroidales bacterium]
MKIYYNPPKTEWEALCKRGGNNNEEIKERVAQILSRVKAGGEAAVREITEEIDGFCPADFVVSEAEYDVAAAKVSNEVKDAIEVAYSNIYKFHNAQKRDEIKVETTPGVVCIQRPVAIKRVGLYIPGGSAPLFSTVLMLAIPAKIAGCSQVIMCTPCNPLGEVAPEVLYTARRCGVDKVFKIGGAQAIAAMAYGAGKVEKVNKIFGPGNRYVTAAKQIVSGESTAIDMPAGPSEVMILADSSARAKFVAADVLSQAEHGPDSQAMVVCTSEEVAEKVLEATLEAAKKLSRTSCVEASLASSRIIVFPEVEQIIEFADEYAAEHLIIQMENPWDVANRISCAGSIFVGEWTPESAGDYASGTNHTLPTSGWAHSCSGVNLSSFIKMITLQQISSEGIAALAPSIVAMAEAEGLEGHANAAKVRIGK